MFRILKILMKFNFVLQTHFINFFSIRITIMIIIKILTKFGVPQSFCQDKNPVRD